MRLEGKTVVITGGGSGYGEGMAHAFANAGARIGILDLRLAAAQKVAADIGSDRGIAIEADVTSRPAIDAALRRLAERFGAPSIVINNAGFTHRNQSALDVDEETFDRVYAVNVKGIFHMVQAVVPALRDQGGGLIINVGSVGGNRPRPGLTWYNGSKAAANLLSKALAVELAPMKIRVNAICPVIGATGMLADFMGMPDTPDNRRAFLTTVPLGRFCEPEDVAEAALYLARSDFITGVELPVDGGRSV